MDKPQEKLSDDKSQDKVVSHILAIAKRIREENGLDNFEVVFKEIIRVVYPS